MILFNKALQFWLGQGGVQNSPKYGCSNGSRHLVVKVQESDSISAMETEKCLWRKMILFNEFFVSEEYNVHQWVL